MGKINKKIVKTKKAPLAIGPYSQAVRVGNFVFCSGQIGLKVDGNFAGDDIESQTKQVLENLKVVLKAAGSNLEKVVKTTVYLKNVAEYPRMNEVYAKYFKTNPPARATIEIKDLPKGALIEIEAIAVC